MAPEPTNNDYCRSIFSTIYQNIPDDNSSDIIQCKSIAWTLANNPDLINENDKLLSCFDDISQIYKSWDNGKNYQKKFILFDNIRSKLSYLYSLFLKNPDPYKRQLFLIKYQEKFNELIHEKLRMIYPELQMTDSEIATINDKLSKFEQIDTLEERKKVKELLEYLEKAKKKAEITIGNIADNKNAGKYKEYYESCRNSAFWLFWTSLSIMFSTAITVVYNCIQYGLIDHSDFSGFLSRVSLTALVLLPSFFMMREAKKLKDKEFQYHDMMARIITSAPYIDGLTNIDEKQKDQMKADLVKDFFARPIECRDDGGLVPVEEICKIVKACVGERQ